MENSERNGNTRPPNLPLEKPYAGQEATVRTGHGTTDCFQIGKGVHQGCILSSCLFNLYVEYIIQNARLDEAQAGFRKGTETKDQIANTRWIIEKAREFQKNIYFCFIDYAKAFECVSSVQSLSCVQLFATP